jgi:hypothetical protein
LTATIELINTAKSVYDCWIATRLIIVDVSPHNSVGSNTHASVVTSGIIIYYRFRNYYYNLLGMTMAIVLVAVHA